MGTFAKTCLLLVFCCPVKSLAHGQVRLEPGATSELADAIAALRAADTGDAAVASAAVALIVLIQCAWRRALAYRRARRKLAVRAAHHYRRVRACDGTG